MNMNNKANNKKFNEKELTRFAEQKYIAYILPVRFLMYMNKIYGISSDDKKGHLKIFRAWLGGIFES